MECIKLTDELLDQLIGFKERESSVTKHKLLKSTAVHDDIVMALAMALKEAVRDKEIKCFGISST